MWDINSGNSIVKKKEKENIGNIIKSLVPKHLSKESIEMATRYMGKKKPHCC